MLVSRQSALIFVGVLCVCLGVQESAATLVYAVHHPDLECCSAPESLCVGHPVQSCQQTGTLSAG